MTDGAEPDRPHALHALFEQIAARPWAFDPYQALRRIEGLSPGTPRLGDASRPGEEPVRLGQQPALAFEPASIAGVQASPHHPPRVYLQMAGLWGPNGPMPLHLTELARERERNHADPTLARFADLFHHRLMLFFYRAWRQAQPAASHDRPHGDRFRTYVGALAGHAAESPAAGRALPSSAARHRVGQIARSARSAEAVADVLADWFGVPVAVEQFVPDWLDMPESARTRLGARDGSATLGAGAVCGARVRDCQHQIELRIGPMGRARYADFLPGGRSLPALREWMRVLTADAWRWRARLLLAPQAVGAATLDGGTRLGLTGWLHGAPRTRPADDLRLAPESIDRMV